MAEDDVTISKADFEALQNANAELKRKGMSKEELKLREIVRDESKATFLEALGEFFSTGKDNDDEDAGSNDGGGGGGIVADIGKLIGMKG